MGIAFFTLFFMLIFMCCGGSSDHEEEAITMEYLSSPLDVECTITSYFGYRIDPITNEPDEFHHGIDLSAPAGTEILASADGVVYKVGYELDGLGNYVYIKHEIDNATVYTIYGHMQDNSIVVDEGQKVKYHDKIGIIGDTGRATGVHLHFQISKGKISFKEEDLIDPIEIVSCKEA